MLNLAVMRERISSLELPAIFETWVTEAFQFGAPGRISLNPSVQGHSRTGWASSRGAGYTVGADAAAASCRKVPYFVSSWR